MKVIITGGSGFLGTLLARRLLAGPISVRGEKPTEVTELIVLDLVAPLADLLSDSRVTAVVGELSRSLRGVADADVIFHLAGVVSSAAEADFDLGMRTNFDDFRTLLEWCRGLEAAPLVVFTSSLAVYGSDEGSGPVTTVDDHTLPRPQSSYGVQKFIGEQLLADYTRREFVNGRSVRLMTVAVRPGRPNAAASSFLSSIIREPLNGEEAICPVPPDTSIALSSPKNTIDGILRAAEVDDARWGSRTAMNLPALTTTPAEMAKALDRVAGAGASDLIRWGNDPAVRAIVESWPARFITARADALGLAQENTVDDIVRQFVADRQQTDV